MLLNPDLREFPLGQVCGKPALGRGMPGGIQVRGREETGIGATRDTTGKTNIGSRRAMDRLPQQGRRGCDELLRDGHGINDAAQWITKARADCARGRKCSSRSLRSSSLMVPHLLPSGQTAGVPLIPCQRG
jgi:hypothetical protein